MESKSLEDVETELARRGRMVLARNPAYWISSAYRDPVKQQRFSDSWQYFLKKHGGKGTAAQRRARAIAAGGVPANTPETSLHSRKPCEALDIGCPPGMEEQRARDFDACGLDTPIPDEPWHVVKRPNWFPGAVVVTHFPTSIIESDDDMPRPDDKIAELVYPGGEKTVGLRDGSILNYGTEHFGAMGNIPPEDKRTFDELITLRAVDPIDHKAGYIVCSRFGHEWKFDAKTRADIEAHR